MRNPIDPHDPAVVAAKKLCTQAHAGRRGFVKAVKEIIDTKAWVALGYSSFLDFWVDEFKKGAPPWEMLPNVVYAMIDDGGTNKAIATTVKGVTAEGVANLRRQKLNNTPAEKASPHRKPTRARPAPDHSTTFVRHPPEFGDHWDALAAQRGVSRSDLVLATMIQVHGRP